MTGDATTGTRRPRRGAPSGPGRRHRSTPGRVSRGRAALATLAGGFALFFFPAAGAPQSRPDTPDLAAKGTVPGGAAAWTVSSGCLGGQRAGAWTRLELVPGPDLGAVAGETVFAWAQDPDGRFVRSPAAVLRARPDGTLAASTHVRIGRPTSRIAVELERAGGRGTPEDTASLPASAVEIVLPDPIPSTHRVLVVVGDLPAARRAARLMSGPGSPPLEVVDQASGSAAAGGDSPLDYDLAEVILVCGRELGSLPAATVAGIDAWVRGGGRLVLCAGGSAATISAAAGPASAWLPGPVERLVPLRRVAGLESYARAGGLAARPGVAGLEVPVFANRRQFAGSVEAFEGSGPTDLPLVTRTAHGFGAITWLAVDPDAGPLRGWSGTDSLLVRALGGRIEQEGLTARHDPGAADLGGQLRESLERAGGPEGASNRVPFEAIAVLGLLYVLMLYPLDWWIASRTRPWLAWVSLPVLVTAFSALAWGIGAARRPPPGAPARAVEVIDLDGAAGSIRGHGWVAAWSDTNASFDLAIAAAPPEEATVSWFADAGTGFGGIDAAMPHPSLAAADCRYDETLAALEGVAVAASSNRLFEACWRRPVDGGEPLLTSALTRDAQGVVEGSFAHHLPFAIENSRLAHGGWVYDIGTLPAARTVDLRATRGPRSLAGALKRPGPTGDREEVGAWDRHEADPLRILEIAGFHAAAGGAAYTLLPPGRLGRIDLSPLLAVDRAVLFGTVRETAAGWTIPWRLARRSAGQATAVDVSTVGRIVRIVIPLSVKGERP